MELSTKRQSFCRYIAIDSLNPTEAYRKAFNVSSDRKATHTEAASRLLKDSNVSARIEALKADISDRLAANIVWDKARIVEQLGFNVEASRNVNQFAASNRSLELLGKAVGNVFEADTVAVSGTVSVIHSLSDAVLDQLAAMGPSEPVTVDDTGAIEASFKLLEPESE